MRVVRQKPTRRAETRRQEAKRQLTELRGHWWQKLIQRVSPSALLIWITFYVVVVGILLSGRESMPWRLNQLLDNDITARVPFEIEDTVRTQSEKKSAASSAPDVYLQNPAPLTAIRGELTELLAIAKAAANAPAELATQLAAKGWTLGDAGIATLVGYAADEARNREYENLVTRLLSEMSSQYLVQKPVSSIREGAPRTAILRRQTEDRTQDIEILTSRLQYVSDAKTVRQVARDVVAHTIPEPLQEPIAERIARTILEPVGGQGPAPLWRYDPAATAESIKLAQDRVPTYTVLYQPGDRIVLANTILTNQELERLRKEHEEYLRLEQTDPRLGQRMLLSQIGIAVIVLMVTLGLATYTAIYQDRVFQKTGRALGLAMLMAAVVLCSRLLNRMQYPYHPAAEFSTFFVVIAVMLLTIAYNQRFAFGAGGALAAFVTLAHRGDFGLFLTLMVGMGAAVFSLRDIRTRSKVVAVGTLAAGAALLASLATGLIAGQDLKYVISHALAAGGAALFAGFIVQGILPDFEKFFGIATSMTLLEWGDASRPLLRRLAQEAPGTYSHSALLSQMAEEAAETIGANGLLARVGALYHDVGKIQKSEYFVENQEARMNRHDRLSPTMSLLVITGHVKDGVEMARAYGLPRVLHQFILEHHGTTVVKYFHHAANEAAAKNTGRHDREVPESEFRYPGPKPRTRESAILMVCDGCEGAVRALTEPTPGRIESTVHQVVMARLNDGQFDDCEITLRELNQVEISVVKSLAAIHHGRIKYPKDSGSSAKPVPAEESSSAGQPAKEADSRSSARPAARPAEVAS